MKNSNQSSASMQMPSELIKIFQINQKKEEKRIEAERQAEIKRLAE